MAGKNVVNGAQKCCDCAHFIPDPVKPGFGFCFGVLVAGERDPILSDKCGGRYFRPK